MEVNKIYNLNCLEGLKLLPDNSINCCITSPPYFGLRDYGTPEQIGLEETPEAFVQKMVEVFTEVRRVLKPEGTLWLNLGDSYSTGSGGDATTSEKQKSSKGTQFAPRKRVEGMKPKDLIGIPWLTALALRESGWYLRQDIIWHKPNPMPESVTDRCTKAHEYIFLMSKSAKYYYDHEAIKMPPAESTIGRGAVSFGGEKGRNYKPDKNDPNFRNGKEQWGRVYEYTDGNVNKRSVWTVTTKPFSEAHFATYPEDLIVDMIKAGCPEEGVVLDPFMGAGTTALVAAKQNRNFIGFELNPDYIAIAENRLKKELGMFHPSPAKLIA